MDAMAQKEKLKRRNAGNFSVLVGSTRAARNGRTAPSKALPRGAKLRRRRNGAGGIASCRGAALKVARSAAERRQKGAERRAAAP